VLGVSSVDNAHPIQRGGELLLDILKDVEHQLPPFRAVFSPHDNPVMFWDYDKKAALLTVSSSGDRKFAESLRYA
jgi:hypothetical protein